jgi:hypothetical protein
VQIVAGMLVVAIVVAVAAWLVIREAGRVAKSPPPALFDLDEAHDWVVAHVPDDVAATVTSDDVRRILEFQLEYFAKKGVSGNGSSAHAGGPVVVGGSEAVAYIVDRAAATGEAYLPEQVYGVLETQLAYLRSIGAVGPPVGDDRDAR